MSIAMPTRRLAALSIGALSAGALTFGALAPAGAAGATVSIDKTYAYSCDVKLDYVLTGAGPGSITLEDQPIGVRAQAAVPAVLEPGTTVPPTATTITLLMNGGLQAATVGLGGLTVDGSSEDSSIGFTLGGHQISVPINGLSVKDSPIPVPADLAHPVDGDWTIPINGTVAAIDVPGGTAGQTVTLQMPSGFSADADFTVDTSTGVESMSALMTCTFDDDSAELLASALPVQARTATTASSTPTTYGTAAQISYTVTGAESGTVQVLEGTSVLANGTFSGGKGTVALPPTLAAGNHSLTVKYVGSASTQSSSATTTVSVAKAAVSVTSAKAKPKKVKVNKKAKLAVTVASSGGAPNGTVTVKLKKKTVGTGSLVGGKATVKLKKFKKAGKQKLTVTYTGSANFNGATKTVKVKVTK